MTITEHFEERLEERFGYDFETLSMDILNDQNEQIILVKNSKELEWFPQFKYKFEKHPDCTLVLYENLNLCMVKGKRNLITCYTIN